jgi:hypothetical protein
VGRPGLFRLIRAKGSHGLAEIIIGNTLPGIRKIPRAPDPLSRFLQFAGVLE